MNMNIKDAINISKLIIIMYDRFTLRDFNKYIKLETNTINNYINKLNKNEYIINDLFHYNPKYIYDLIKKLFINVNKLEIFFNDFYDGAYIS